MLIDPSGPSCTPLSSGTPRPPTSKVRPALKAGVVPSCSKASMLPPPFRFRRLVPSPSFSCRLPLPVLLGAKRRGPCRPHPRG